MKALTFNQEIDRYYICNGFFFCSYKLTVGNCTVAVPWSVSREFEIDDVIAYMEDEVENPNVSAEVVARFVYAFREDLLEVMRLYQQEAKRLLV